MDVSEGARLRVVVYRRVSDTKQEKDGDSLSTQQQDCFAWVRERDGVLVADLADVHTGRELEDRPAMAEVRKLIRACKCNVVLVRKFDRLDRSHEIRAALRYEARRFGVQYASVVEGMVDETPNGRLNDFILAFIGEGELDSITERAVRGMRNRADKGLPLVGPRPLYGYRWVDPKRGVYEPDPPRRRSWSWSSPSLPMVARCIVS
jgi:DNA invertase Pin-like site-specific DNA recombinase